jgi:hypothetical protein
VEGLPAEAKPHLTLQLSSPIEEGTLNALYDPLNTSGSDDAASGQAHGSIVVFRGVEPTVATLTVAAKDADIPLGSSAPHEVAPLCSLDPMDVKDKYVTDLSVAIIAPGSGDDEATAAATVEDAAPAAASVSDGSSSDDKVAEAEVVAIQPICTVTLRITYKPSPKDQREELYELLNKTSQRKASALENLRKISMQAAANRSALASSSAANNDPSGAEGTVSKPSVKPGFLNKSKKEPEGTWKALYEKTIGPNSLLRQCAFLAFAAKDYFIFFGAVAFFHFKGQLLAIPPPV